MSETTNRTPRDEMQLAYALQNEAAHTARVLNPRAYYGKPSRRMARHPAPARKVQIATVDDE